MSENTDQQNHDEAIAESAADSDTGTQEPAETRPDDDSKPGKEAARYRRQLRDTETRLQQANDALTTARNQLLDKVLDPKLRAAVSLAKADINTLFTDDGTLDGQAVETLSKELVSQAPGLGDNLGTWRKDAPQPDPSQGAKDSFTFGDAWQGAFKPS